MDSGDDMLLAERLGGGWRLENGIRPRGGNTSARPRDVRTTYVRGHLGLLASKRYTDYEDALRESGLIAEIFQGVSRIRIELEEVTLTHVGPGVEQPSLSGGYCCSQVDLVHALFRGFSAL